MRIALPTAFLIVLVCPCAAQAPLTLDQITQMAADASPSLTAARQNVAQAQARAGQAQAQKRFQLTFNSTASLSNAKVYQPPPRQETFGTLQNTLTVPLPLGRRPGLAVTEAQEQQEAASAQLDSARLALAGQAASAYYDVLRKQALLAVAQQTLLEDQRALGDVQKRTAAGDAAQLDVLQAQVPVASAQAALDGAENDFAVAVETLNSLLGRPLDAPVLLADIPPNALALPYTLAQAEQFSLSRSPDLRAAEATVRADQAAIAAARLYRERDKFSERRYCTSCRYPAVVGRRPRPGAGAGSPSRPCRSIGAGRSRPPDRSRRCQRSVSHGPKPPPPD